VSQPLQAVQFIVSGGLRGAGDTRYTAFVIMITTLGVRSVLAVLLVTWLKWGLWGAWIALMLDQVLRTVLMVARYGTGKWVQIWGARKK
jgi:Na+-driven multidrug efflux pump